MSVQSNATPTYTVIWSDDKWDMLNGNREQKRILIKMRYIEMGLIPPCDADNAMNRGELHDVDMALASMSPEERQAATRKFRKLSRKLGKGKKIKSRGGKRSALYSAFWRIISEEIDPKIDFDDSWPYLV